MTDKGVLLTNEMLLLLARSRLESESITLSLRRSVTSDTPIRRHLCDRAKPLFTDSKLSLNLTALLVIIDILFMFN